MVSLGDLSTAGSKMLFNYKGIYNGTIRGAEMMIAIGAMLGSLGIVIRVLTTTGLGEKISYAMVRSRCKLAIKFSELTTQ